MLPLVIRSGAGIFGSEDVKIRWDKEKKLRFGKLRILRSITNYETPLSSTSDGLKLMIDLIVQVEGGAIWRNGGLPASCSL